MRSDQQLIGQLREAVEGAKQALEQAKQRQKARILALRAEQQRETQGLQGQIRGYEKALKAITRDDGHCVMGEAAIQVRAREDLRLGRVSESKKSGESRFSLFKGARPTDRQAEGQTPTQPSVR